MLDFNFSDLFMSKLKSKSNRNKFSLSDKEAIVKLYLARRLFVKWYLHGFISVISGSDN